MMLIKISTQLTQFAGVLNRDLEKQLSVLAEKTDLAFLIRAIDIFMKRKQELRYSEIAQLPLELAILELINTPECLKPFKPVEKKIVEPSVKPEEIKSVPPTEPVKKNSRNAPINFDIIKEKWGEVLEGVKKHNHTLASVIKICKPIKLDENGALEICSEHKFNQQRINDSKNRQILEKVFEDIFGLPIAVRATVSVEDFEKSDFNYVQPATDQDQTVKSVLDMFGGQLL